MPAILIHSRPSEAKHSKMDIYEILVEGEQLTEFPAPQNIPLAQVLRRAVAAVERVERG